MPTEHVILGYKLDELSPKAREIEFDVQGNIL